MPFVYIPTRHGKRSDDFIDYRHFLFLPFHWRKAYPTLLAKKEGCRD